MTRKLALLVVVFVDRSRADVEVIHLISARNAVEYEESILRQVTLDLAIQRPL